jgi:hypothetical protein
VRLFGYHFEIYELITDSVSIPNGGGAELCPEISKYFKSKQKLELMDKHI